MTPRVQRLRQQSLDTTPSLSAERAQLVTEAVERAGPVSAPTLRAQVFRHVLENKRIYIGDDERDIVAGKAAGMVTLVAAYGYIGASVDIHAWNADGIVEQSRELLQHPLLRSLSDLG